MYFRFECFIGKEIAKSEVMTPPPQPKRLPRDWQNRAIYTKGSWMLIKFGEKSYILRGIIRVIKVSTGKLRVAKIILLM